MKLPLFKLSVLALAITLAACSTDSRNENKVDAHVDGPVKTKSVVSAEVRAQVSKARKSEAVARQRGRPVQEALLAAGSVVSMGMPARLYDVGVFIRV